MSFKAGHISQTRFENTEGLGRYSRRFLIRRSKIREASGFWCSISLDWVSGQAYDTVVANFPRRSTGMPAITNTLIEVDAQGVAWISGTKVKVIEVALDKLAPGSSPEEMHFQYPHLSLAQIHAALAYYYEHQTELDAEIQRRWQEANELAAREAASPLQQRLRELRRQR